MGLRRARGHKVSKRRTEFVAARKSAGYTQEGLAEALGVDRSTVIRWEAGDYAPLPYLRPKLARLINQSPEKLQRLIDGELRDSAHIELNQDIDQACGWLDQQLGVKAGRSQHYVRSALRQADPVDLRYRRARQGKVGRCEVANALRSYYADELPGYEQYRWSASDGREIVTSILTRPEWVNIRATLDADADAIHLASTDTYTSSYIDPQRARQRLVEAQTLGTRISNEPIYRLQDIDIRDGNITGAVSLAQFVDYALTADLLEAELLDMLAGGREIKRGSLPLRDIYLPSLATVLDLRSRLCAGGVLALLAIRRATPSTDESDYLLLIQERSGHVVNTASQLAVIPKGFHQPLADYHADCQLRISLLRELEEELFGRSELDNTSQFVRRSADPMHPRRMTDALNWLVAEPDRLRMECTGFGVNLVSGNFEFACLIVIDDEGFWPEFGGTLEANWEASGVRRYSSNDRDALAALIADKTWTNEGLFALLLGLERLRTFHEPGRS